MMSSAVSLVLLLRVYVIFKSVFDDLQTFLNGGHL